MEARLIVSLNILIFLAVVRGFSPVAVHKIHRSPDLHITQLSKGEVDTRDDVKRKDFLVLFGSIITSSVISGSARNAYAADEAEVVEESFASIAARASKMSSEAGERARTSVVTNGSDGSKPSSEASEPTPISVVTKVGGDTRTAYDFGLPISGISIPFKEIIKQEINDESGQSKVKVILVSNMKEDDPVARKDIPEFISLAAKYGRNGEFAVILSPTDQGYYEPDTSQLIRLKLASEYGYGLNPVCVLTDKVNMLGAQAVPFWRWLQSNCRTPAGLGRVEGNFEKFLIDGQTGLPLRRYPRKYNPTDIKNDIEAILAGRPLPPAGANFREEWRSAAVEAEQGTYRFQKGLNYYD